MSLLIGHSTAARRCRAMAHFCQLGCACQSLTSLSELKFDQGDAALTKSIFFLLVRRYEEAKLG
jgi:hypothetical protein